VNTWKHDTNTHVEVISYTYVCAVSYASKMHALKFSVYDDSWCTGTKNVTSTIIKKN